MVIFGPKLFEVHGLTPLEKWPFLDQNGGLTPLEKCQFFRTF